MICYICGHNGGGTASDRLYPVQTFPANLFAHARCVGQSVDSLCKSLRKWRKYMALSVAQAKFSKDPSTQVGAVLLSRRDNVEFVASTGYNGFPPGFPDTAEFWERPTKYLYVNHAEINTILRAGISGHPTVGTTLISTTAVCGGCAPKIAGAGVSRVVVPYNSVFASMTDQDVTVRTNVFKYCGVDYVTLPWTLEV
jgi:dCMP deaminase